MNVFIETPRLFLRQWRQSDQEPFAGMNSDPEVMHYFPEPYSRERSNHFFEAIQREFEEHGYGLYAAEEKASGLFMGYIGFHWAKMDLEFCPCIEIGWRINKNFWNKGFATEGAMACLDFGFNRLGFGRVFSFTAALNIPSERVMQKIGMRLERHFEHPGVPENHQLRPHVLYVATADRMQPGGVAIGDRE